jgi:hypothetical protein
VFINAVKVGYSSIINWCIGASETTRQWLKDKKYESGWHDLHAYCNFELSSHSKRKKYLESITRARSIPFWTMGHSEDVSGQIHADIGIEGQFSAILHARNLAPPVLVINSIWFTQSSKILQYLGKTWYWWVSSKWCSRYWNLCVSYEVFSNKTPKAKYEAIRHSDSPCHSSRSSTQTPSVALCWHRLQLLSQHLVSISIPPVLMHTIIV